MNKRFGFYGFGLLAIMLFNACKTTQPIKPKESYLKMKKESGVSSINIPVQLDFKELEKTINEELANLKFEDKLGGEDMTVKAMKKGDIQINVGKDNISYNVPIYLWINKKTVLGNIEAEGEIALDFQTGYAIDEKWDLTTQTEVKDYAWNKKPVLKLGFVDIPISFVADWILDKSKEHLCKAIDREIHNNFVLRNYVEEAWKTLQEPFLISEEYKLWLKLMPQLVQMSPLLVKDEKLTSTIKMEAASDIVFGEKPVIEKSNELPPFNMGESVSDDFLISLKVDIPYEEAATMARKHLKGERFTSGKYAVTVEDIELYGRGNKLVVNAGLSGSYNGSIYLVGKPIYNAETNTIELESLDYELTTKNFLVKSLSWLFHKGIEKRLQKQLKFPLQENIQKIKEQVEEKLKYFEIQKNILLKGKLNELDIARTYLTTDGIRVIVASTGRVDLFVKGLK